MANRLKKSNPPKPAVEETEVLANVQEEKPVMKKGKEKREKKAPAKTNSTIDTVEKFKKEREEKIDLKKIAKDERTHKIIGTISLLVSIFLFIGFVSYLFTWQEDQDKVWQHGVDFLFANDIKVENLLGRLGAFTAHHIIRNGFGLASFLFCTFFFVVGINLLFGKKVFSVCRNLRYVTIGLLILSVSLAFLTPTSAFPYGGHVGDLINNWLSNFLGIVGTGALLLVVGVSYLIWQFNPKFKLPEKKEKQFVSIASEEEKDAEQQLITPIISSEDENSIVVNDKGNLLKGDGAMVFQGLEDANAIPLNIIEKEEGEETTAEEEVDLEEESETPVEKELVDDLLHRHDAPVKEVEPVVIPPRPEPQIPTSNIQLEIKITEPEPENDVTEKGYGDLPPYEPTLDLRDYKYPTVDLLHTHGSEKIVQDPAELEANKNQIINTLKNYDITIQKISATVGPTVTLYEIVPAPGVRISRIKNLEDDIALSLAALGIRIIAPIPGKGTIGIEVPNVRKSLVSMKTMLSSDKFTNNHYSLPIAIGKKIDNELFIVDLASMPHLLMAGATGQGKSVGLNAILVSLLYKKHPSQLKMVLVDPKKVELSIYRHIEKHFLAKLPGEEDAIITDTKKVINTLNALCIEMDNRYDLLKEAGARNIKEYNEKFTKRKLNPQKRHQYLPFIVLVVDEFADLIMTAGKEVEMPIARLAQLARAVGIHLIIATQRPSVNIITGTIKANFPARIAFKVSSKIDSRTILDAGGAEQLIGKGDMLISYNGEIVRLQCAFVDTPEVESVVEFISDQRGYPQAFLLPEYIDEKDAEGRDFDATDKDPFFEEAAKLIVQNQVGSTSLIQRRMKLGYNRAGRLMDQLEAARIVGPNQGSKAREVLIKTEAELMELLQNF